MATIIDSLLVTLGLDSSEFDSKRSKVDKGLKSTGDEADKTGKKLKQSGKSGAEGYETLTKSAAKFLALIGGTMAVKRFIEQTIESSAALALLSRNLGESANTISAWSNAAELAGGSAEGLQGTMDMLSKSQTELQLTGQSGLIPYFTALGVGLADVNGKARPVNDILLDLSERFARMDRTTANNFGRMMGIDQGTMQLLLKGRTEVELMIARQKEYGAVTKKQAEEGARLKFMMRESTQTFVAFGRELLSKATPAIEKFFQIMADFGAWAQNHQEFITTFLTIITAGLVAMGAAAIPINLVAVAVIGLAAGIAALWDDYQVWKRGGDSLIDWSKWEPGIKAAGEGIKWLRDLVSDAFYRMFAVIDAGSKALSGDWVGARMAIGEAINGNGDTYGGDGPQSPGTPGVNAPSAPSPAGGKKLPRGIRNNNPGNLNFAGQAGASKEGGPGGRFAKFGTMREGVAALVKQIGLYVSRGKNSIRKILEVYAPTSENNTGAYIAAVSRALGIGPDDPLDINSSEQVMGLVKAITDHENGKGYVGAADIAGGYNLAKTSGIRGASRAAEGAGAAKVAQVSAAGSGSGGNVSNVETSIGEVKIYTAATDAEGIAKDMSKSLNYSFAAQANLGMS